MNALPKLALAAAVILCFASPVLSQEHNHDAHGPNQAAGTAGRMADGEVKKIDKDAGKITIRHGELKDLGMPAMTMVFRVKDAAMLEQVKVGDKIRFLPEKTDGVFTVMTLENVK